MADFINDIRARMQATESYAHGEVNPHNPTPFVLSSGCQSTHVQTDPRSQHEWLIRHPVLSSSRIGRGYLYKIENGQYVLSHYPPENIQWQNGPS